MGVLIGLLCGHRVRERTACRARWFKAPVRRSRVIEPVYMALPGAVGCLLPEPRAGIGIRMGPPPGGQ